MGGRRKRTQSSELAEALDLLRSRVAAATSAAGFVASEEDAANDDLDVDARIRNWTRQRQQWEQVSAALKSALSSETAVSAALLRIGTNAGAGYGNAPDSGTPAATPATAPPPYKRRRTEPELDVGATVAYRLPRSPENEWIQCEVTRVLQDGQRYEVRDSEPDESDQSGKLFRANIHDLLVLPTDQQPIPTIAPGTVVLAQYPETTAFYRATVRGQTRSGDYRLLFEGEEDGKVTEVPRRLVLPFPSA